MRQRRTCGADPHDRHRHLCFAVRPGDRTNRFCEDPNVTHLPHLRALPRDALARQSYYCFLKSRHEAFTAVGTTLVRATLWARSAAPPMSSARSRWVPIASGGCKSATILDQWRKLAMWWDVCYRKGNYCPCLLTLRKHNAIF
jgi:hypothetical protein